MKYKLYLRNRTEIVLEDGQYRKIENAILSQADEMVAINGSVFNARDVKSVTPYSGDVATRIKHDMSYRDEKKLEFLRQEEEYRGESSRDKAIREYYTRFMGMVLSAYGLKKVLGNDYVSPATAKEAFGDGWEFTEEQRMDRRKRFDRWVENSNWPTLWGKDLKNFLVEYYEVNPDKSWCDLEEWWPIFVEGKLPTTKFDKVLIAHEKQTQNL